MCYPTCTHTDVIFPNIPKWWKAQELFDRLWRFRCAINMPKPLQIHRQPSVSLYRSQSVIMFWRGKERTVLSGLSPTQLHFSHTVQGSTHHSFVGFSFQCSFCLVPSGWILLCGYLLVNTVAGVNGEILQLPVEIRVLIFRTITFTFVYNLPDAIIQSHAVHSMYQFVRNNQTNMLWIDI